MLPNWNEISEDYYTEIVSPWIHGNAHELKKELRKHKGKTMLDIGCGVGGSFSFLTTIFEKVDAFDSSLGMVKQSIELTKKYKNISVSKKDIIRFNTKKYDVVLSVNSLLMPDNKALDKAFKNIRKCTREVFVGVFPAMEEVLYEAFLVARKEGQKHTRSLFKKEHDFVNGIVTYENETQKFFYAFELEQRLKKAGFKDIRITKLTYPWKIYKESGRLYFPKEDEPWDWLVIAKP